MNVRSFATPLTIAAFLSVGITGLCMVFDFKGGMVGSFHEFSGILLLAASALHLWVNKTMLFKHLRSRTGAILAILAVVLVILSLLPWGGKPTEGRGKAGNQLMAAATRSDLKGVAILARKSPTSAATDLRKLGLVVESENISIEELARRNHRTPFEILSLVLPQSEEDED